MQLTGELERERAAGRAARREAEEARAQARAAEQRLATEEAQARALRERMAAATAARLTAAAARLAGRLAAAGWPAVGATALFVPVETGDAQAAQARLARARIWTRAFPWSRGWLRLGLPGAADEWARLAAALTGER
ncbi:MAG: hypothetical protein ACK4MU_09290, partial [Thermomonas sp.]